MVVAWLLPAHWKSLDPSLVACAGRGTPTLGELGLAMVALDKPGPASLVLAAAQSGRDPQSVKLAADLVNLNARKPELRAWGGHAPLLEMIFKSGAAPTKPISEPVLPVFLAEPARELLRQHLSTSLSPGVQAIRQTCDLTSTTRFVPALRPGGQPFEATILLMAVLYEGEFLSPSLAQEVKVLAETANATRIAVEWEVACLDLLALGARLNWVQLAELLRVVPNLKTLSEFARIVKATPESLPLVYSASLLTQSPEGVTKYLVRFGKSGHDNLTMALSNGQGAVRLLIQRQLPMGSRRAGTLAFAAPLVLKAPRTMLALKTVVFLLAGFCFYLVWNELSAVEIGGQSPAGTRALRLQRTAAAVLLTVLLIAASEPFMFRQAGSPEYQVRLKLPVLTNQPVPKDKAPQPKTQRMNLDLFTILSIVLFAALQVGVYTVCLRKIREIEMQAAAPQLKLRLMDNEENLFDSGLYVGIAGTAAALVLQVLGLIEANLLAAYSSNLFGIVCVALVKIRHVRDCKRRLILQSQTERAPQPASQPAA